MPSQFAPDEPPSLLKLERTTLAGVAIMCVSYGMEFMLWIATLYAILKRYHLQHPHARFLLSYISLLFLLATIATACVINNTISAWVDNREFEGGPVLFGLENGRSPSYLTELMAYNLMSFLQDGYLLWRFFIIWNRNIWILIIPFLLYVASMTTSTLQWALILKSGTSFLSSSHIDIGLVSWILSISTNILLTFLIILRILIARRLHHSQSQSQSFAGSLGTVTAILIESQAIYAVVGIIVLATLMVDINAVNVLANTFGVMEAFAPTLVVYRVATSTAWTGSSTALSSISSVRLSRIGWATVENNMDDIHHNNNHTRNDSSGPYRIATINSVTWNDKSGSIQGAQFERVV